MLNAKITSRECKATFVHVNKLAKFYGVSNVVMLNAILMGGFHEQLLEVMGK